MEITKIENKEKSFTSLELTNLINQFRREEGRKTELKHYTLMEIIREEFEEEIADQKILGGSYKDKQNQERPMFILTSEQSKQILMRESKFVRKAVIKYIDSLEEKVKEFISGKDKALLDIINAKSKEETAFALKHYQDNYVIPLEKEIEYKQDIITHLVEDVPVETMRVTINRIIRHTNDKTKIPDRWKKLYEKFCNKEHFNLNAKYKNSSKKTSKLEIIEKYGYLRSLYELCIKLYEADYKDLLTQEINLMN